MDKSSVFFEKKGDLFANTIVFPYFCRKIV